MICRKFSFLLKILMLLAFLPSFSQQKNTSDFWKNVQFGGGLGLGFGTNYTNIAVAPSAIYNVNKYFATGVGLQYNYLRQQDQFTASQYGVSVIELFNPIEEIQLSLELEQLRVNLSYDASLGIPRDSFWNTGLFIGAGYCSNNVTIGGRYNVLYQQDRNVYGSAFMPFVRVFF